MAQKTGMRGVLCALLLALLAVCGYVGAGREQTHTVSAAVTRVTLPEQTQDDALDAAERYRAQRSEEIALRRQLRAQRPKSGERQHLHEQPADHPQAPPCRRFRRRHLHQRTHRTQRT